MKNRPINNRVIAALDIETLSLDRETCAVYEVGAVKMRLDTGRPFSQRNQETCLIRLDLAEQFLVGRTINKKTIDFHLGHAAKNFKDMTSFLNVLPPNTYKNANVSIAEMQTTLRGFLEDADEIWINGLSFDPVIIDSLGKSIGSPGVPWDFRKEVDVRSIRRIVPFTKSVKTVEGAKHESVADAEWNLEQAHLYYTWLLKVDSDLMVYEDD